MEITIKGESKEIAALVLELQERQGLEELDNKDLANNIISLINRGCRSQFPSIPLAL